MTVPFLSDDEKLDAYHDLTVEADDLTLSVPVSAHQDHSLIEVNSIQHWAVRNRMKLNLTKTWEMVVHGRISKQLPPLVQGIERKSWLRLLGIIFQENPSD